jgi:replicative DNA helicase
MDAKTTTADGPEHHDSHLFNDAVEQALLGSILIDNGAIAQVSDFVRPEHFGDPLHQRLYAQLLKMTGRLGVSPTKSNRSRSI